EWLRGPTGQGQDAEGLAPALDRHAHEHVDPFLSRDRRRAGPEVEGLRRVAQMHRAPAGGDATDDPLTGRQNAGDLAQAWPESPVTAQMQRRAVGGQQMKAGNLEIGRA